MTVRPFELVSLPRVTGPRRGIGAASATHVTAIVGRTIDMRTSPFGAGTLTCSEVAMPQPPEEGDVVWALSRGGEAELGYLVLDAMTALRIVAATLGVPVSRINRPLGTSERGIVTAAIATALRLLAPRADFSVHLGRRPWDGRGRSRLHISADFKNLREHFRLDLFDHWLPAPNPEAWLGEAAGIRCLEIPFAVELARTTLTAAEWARARPGDAVVFDGERPWTQGEPRAARLRCGAFSCPIGVAADGRVTLASDFQSDRLAGTDPAGVVPAEPVSDSIKMSVAEMDGPSSPTANHHGEIMSTETSVALTMLAAAPIEVVAEIGRIVMRADEVISLRPGSVLPIGPLRPNTVTLRVGERLWADGELVDVDGQLAVRLTTLATRTTAPTQAAAPLEAEAETLR